jgi:hypothetical protein
MKRPLVAALLFSPLTLWSQTTDVPEKPALPEVKLTEAQVQSITSQLEKLETDILKNRSTSLGSALAALQRSMNSETDARDLYLSCYKSVHFDRKDLKDSDFTDWKTKNAPRFKDPEYLMGLRLQCEYLVLSIQAMEAKDIATVIPNLQNFMLKELAAVEGTVKHTSNGAVQVERKDAKPGKSGRPQRSIGSPQILDMLRKNIKGTEFAKAYLLDEFLKSKEWEYQPMDFNGIYRTVIFPYYRDKKPTELGAQWDNFTKLDFTMQEATTSESEYQLFYKERFPERQWEKSNDLYTNNINPVIALADMLKTVKENPTHPKAAEWLKHLRELVNLHSGDKPTLSTTPDPTGATPPPAAAN